MPQLSGHFPRHEPVVIPVVIVPLGLIIDTQQDSKLRLFKAVLTTGVDISGVSQNVAVELGLLQAVTPPPSTSVLSLETKYSFQLGLVQPNKAKYNVHLLNAPLVISSYLTNTPYDVVIGNDIIDLGNFHKFGTTGYWSLELPDYVSRCITI